MTTLNEGASTFPPFYRRIVCFVGTYSMGNDLSGGKRYSRL